MRQRVVMSVTMPPCKACARSAAFMARGGGVGASEHVLVVRGAVEEGLWRVRVCGRSGRSLRRQSV